MLAEVFKKRFSRLLERHLQKTHKILILHILALFNKQHRRIDLRGRRKGGGFYNKESFCLSRTLCQHRQGGELPISRLGAKLIRHLLLQHHQYIFAVLVSKRL